MSCDYLIITDNLNTIIQTDQSWDLLTSTDIGPKGDPGDPKRVYTAAEVISGHKVVLVDETGKIAKASCTVVTDALAIVGVTTDAVTAGQTTVVTSSGSIEHLGWTFMTNYPIYLGNDGTLTQTLPPVRAFTKIIAFATAPTIININIQPAILVN